MCAYIADEVTILAGALRACHVAVGRVGHRAFFANFVHHQAAETATEVLVESIVIHIGSDVVGLAVDVEIDFGLLHIAVRQEVDGLFVVLHAVENDGRFALCQILFQRQIVLADVGHLVGGSAAHEVNFQFVAGGIDNGTRQV